MEKLIPYTISVFAENTPGILYRLADLFLRRKINIESLTVSETETHGISRFTIVVRADAHVLEKIVKQIYRIIEVTRVVENTDEGLIFKEIALIKVATKNAGARGEIKDVVSLSDAKILFVSGNYLVVEKAGSEEEINSLLWLLRPFGIKEFIRSGRIAVIKD